MNSNNNNVVLYAFLGRRYIITKSIGQGAFGLAMVARMPYHDNQLVVVKRLKYLAPGFSGSGDVDLLHHHHQNQNPNQVSYSPSPRSARRPSVASDHAIVTSPLERNKKHFGAPPVPRIQRSMSSRAPSSCSSSTASTSESSSTLFSPETQIKVTEVQALACLSHPNIVRFYEAWFDKSDGHLYFSMEYCSGRDLDYFMRHNTSTAIPTNMSGQNSNNNNNNFSSQESQNMRNNKSNLQNNQNNNNSSKISWPLPESWIVSWLHQILSALYYMHAHRVVHRDIKLQNIFVELNDRENKNSKNETERNSNPPTLKIGDFGLSRFLASSNDNAASTKGSVCYFSPEIASGNPHNFKTDVWSAGVVFFVLMTRIFPFGGNSLVAVLHSIRTFNPSFSSDSGEGDNNSSSSFYSQDLKRVVLAMLIKDPMKRPSAGSLLNFVCKSLMVAPTSQNNNFNNNIRESPSPANQLSARMKNNFTPIPTLLQQQQQNILNCNDNNNNNVNKILTPFRMMLLKFQVPVQQNQQSASANSFATFQTLTVNLRSAPSINATCVGKLTWGDVILVVEVLKAKENNNHNMVLPSDKSTTNSTRQRNGNDDFDDDDEENEEYFEEEEEEEGDDENDSDLSGVWYRITEPIPSYCIATLNGKQLFGRIVVDDHLTQMATEISAVPVSSARVANGGKKSARCNNVMGRNLQQENQQLPRASPHLVSKFSGSSTQINNSNTAAAMRRILSLSPVAAEVNGN